MTALLDVILPVFLVIGFGYTSAWRGYLSETVIDGVADFAQNIAIPCLLFLAISTLDLDATFDLNLMGSYYISASAIFVAGLFGARWLFARPWEDCVAIGFTALFSNTVLLGLAITEKAYGADALGPNYAIVAVHAPFCYGVGITVMEFVRSKDVPVSKLVPTVARAMFRNALLVGIALGFAVNLSGMALPGFATEGLELIARAALPAALFALGGVLFRYRPEGDSGPIILICVLTLGVLPMLVWSLGTFTGLGRDAMRSAVLTASMAPGASAYLFANMYGVARRVVASSVLIGTAVSILTVWGWLTLLP